MQYRSKPFFENAIPLLVYPVETIFSEKLETILSKGPNNSRMKDYHDLILLIRNEGMLNLDKLKEAMTSTFSNRRTSLRPIEFDKSSLNAIQKLWIAHLHGLGDNAQDFELSKEITAVIEEVNRYVAAVNGIANVEKISLETQSPI